MAAVEWSPIRPTAAVECVFYGLSAVAFALLANFTYHFLYEGVVLPRASLSSRRSSAGSLISIVSDEGLSPTTVESPDSYFASSGARTWICAPGGGSATDRRATASASSVSISITSAGKSRSAVGSRSAPSTSPTAALVEDWVGELPPTSDPRGEQSALSTAKAADLLDWTPSHARRAAANADVPEPNVLAEDPA